MTIIIGVGGSPFSAAAVSALERLLMGSVAAGVSTHVPCSVRIVRRYVQ